MDVETTSLDEMQADLVGVSFSVVPGEAAYLPLCLEGTFGVQVLDHELIPENLDSVNQIARFVESKTKSKAAGS